MSWGTLLPWHICWNNYYDPRCFRGSSSSLAMICVSSVMILAVIIESIPWCHLVSRHSISGFEPKIHSTYLLLIVFARSFRILVTFVIVFEVRGISFFQIPWTILGRSSFEPKDHNQGALEEYSIHIVTLPVLPPLHGLSGRNMLNLFDILIHGSTT